MAKKSVSGQNIISAIKRVEKSLRSEFKRVLRQEILRVEKRVEDIQEQQKVASVKLDKIDKTLDGFVGRVDNLTIENEVGTKQVEELRERVDDHEERITKLESPAQP